jgi:vitamin K-dependent gamma-carboxylase-like protein
MTVTATPSPPRANPARWSLTAFDALLGTPVSMRSMALLRVLIGPVVLLHLRPILDAARAGRIYRDSFYEPYANWYPELPRGLYIAMLWVAVFAALAMTIGLLTRIATVTAFVIVTYNVFLSTTTMHNNRAYLIVVLAALAVTPCGRELSVDAWLRRMRGRPALPTASPGWPLWLLRFEAATVYGASGFSKLIDRDWFSGTVTWQRVVLVRDRVDASVLPAWAVDVLTDRSFHTVAAKLIIATELSIAVGLWSRRTRYAAVWLAICFHVAIELSAEVQVFSFLAIAALVIWSVPSTRDRVLVLDPDSPSQRRFAVLVRSLDWLARFRIEWQATGGPVTLVDRDGHRIEGCWAVCRTMSRLPLTAWFVLPLLLLPGGRSHPAPAGSLA